MKRWKRWITLVLVMLLCVSLCGCSELETMREKHAVWQEDGSILWNGNVYRKLDVEDSLQELDVSYDYITIYVTEPDVPVLLSDWFGDAMDVGAHGTLLHYYDYRYGERNHIFYCREDVYDEMVVYLKGKIQITTYYYHYYDDEAEQSVPYYLTEEQKNTIQRILATVIPISYENMNKDWIDCFALYGCDDSHMFGNGVEMWLGVTDTRYFIQLGDDFYFVPMVDNEIFAAIWEPYYNDGFNAGPPSIVI